MRGLPPPPADVCSIECVWSIGPTQECTTTFWLFAPGIDTSTTLQVNTLLGDFFTLCLPDLLPLLGTDVTCTVLRLTHWGPDPLVYSYVPAPNSGGTGTSNPINGALVLTWRNGRRGSAALGHTFLPLSDTLVDDDHARLKAITWSQAKQAATTFLGHVNALFSPDGATCVLVTISRSQSGAPRPFALMSPVELGDASPFIGTMRRRVRARRPASSPI